MSATVQIKRLLQVINSELSLEVDDREITETAGKFYLPFQLNNFEPNTITLQNVNSTTGQSKLTSTVAGTFDNIKVGDIISGLDTGIITAKSTITRDCLTDVGLPYVIYESSFDSTSLGVSVGDYIDGTGVDEGTTVTKIDYSNRRIFLSANATARGESTLTIAPLVRVTAVRKSTATANANQIDFDSTVGTGANGDEAYLLVGAKEATFAVLRIETIGSSTDAKLTTVVSAVTLTGANVVGSKSGNNNLDYTTLNYFTVGSFTLDSDGFLTTARLPRPTA